MSLQVLLNPDDDSEGGGGDGKMDGADRQDQVSTTQIWLRTMLSQMRMHMVAEKQPLPCKGSALPIELFAQ